MMHTTNANTLSNYYNVYLNTHLNLNVAEMH